MPLLPRSQGPCAAPLALPQREVPAAAETPAPPVRCHLPPRRRPGSNRDLGSGPRARPLQTGVLVSQPVFKTVVEPVGIAEGMQFDSCARPWNHHHDRGDGHVGSPTVSGRPCATPPTKPAQTTADLLPSSETRACSLELRISAIIQQAGTGEAGPFPSTAPNTFTPPCVSTAPRIGP